MPQGHRGPWNVCRVTRVALGWAIDRSCSPIAQKVAPLTFGVVGGTRALLISLRTFTLQKRLLVCKFLKACLPGSPATEAKQVGPSTAMYGTVTSQRSRRSEGGECCKDCPGLGHRSIFHPCSSVGSTFTVVSSACERRRYQGRRGDNSRRAVAVPVAV